MHIGNQSRPKLFDMAINKPDVLYSKVIEISERVTLEAWTESKTPTPIDTTKDSDLVKGVTGEAVRILESIGIWDPFFPGTGLTGGRYRRHRAVFTRSL